MVDNQVAELSRKILSDLRDIMTSLNDDEQKLQQIVDKVSRHLKVSVCSIYALRAGEVLELYATHGLSETAIHQTRLRVGEGLVGLVAASKKLHNLGNIKQHPEFAFRPETHEEDFNNFLGVPLLRQGNLIAVLVIQSEEMQAFSKAIEELMENIAMFLNEFLAASKLISREEILSTQGLHSGAIILKGVRLNNGIALGKAYVHRSDFLITEFISKNRNLEHQKLKDALELMHNHLDEMIKKQHKVSKSRYHEGEHVEILETYSQIARDKGWIKRIHDAIDEGLSALAAVHKVTAAVKMQLLASQDLYLQERAMDFDDLGQRLIRYLHPDQSQLKHQEPQEDFIVFAKSLGPARLLDFNLKYLKGLVLAEATKNAHVTIVAKSLNIPVISLSIENFSKVETGDDVCLDATHHTLVLRADDNLKEQYKNTIRARQQLVQNVPPLSFRPAITLDNQRVYLKANVGLRIDMEHFKRIEPDGVGLFRTEIPFMLRANLPDVQSQTEIYRDVLNAAGKRIVTFRTLDVGSDKVLPWRAAIEEENPAMGWRAARVSTDIPGLLRHQLKAFISAAKGRPLHVMFPMVSDMHEWHFCNNILQHELERFKAKKEQLPSEVKVGIMFEVPALMLQLDEIMAAVDFVSIGSNDLTQFIFAMDRGSPIVGERYDGISPIILRLYKMILSKAKEYDVPVTLCGEVSSDPIAALALVALGFRDLSMSPLAIPMVRDAICSLDLGALTKWLDKILYKETPMHFRALLKIWLQDHNVQIN